jgi:hypothetical protein
MLAIDELGPFISFSRTTVVHEVARHCTYLLNDHRGRQREVIQKCHFYINHLKLVHPALVLRLVAFLKKAGVNKE